MLDLLLVADVVLQNGFEFDLTPGAGLVSGAIGSFATTLIVGGILVILAPDYTERMMGEALENPLLSFLYGFILLIALVVAIVILVLTIVGILVVIPLVILAYLAWAVGVTVVLLAIGERLVGLEDGWLKPLLVAAAINGLLALSGVGGLVSFVIGAWGFGTVVTDVIA